MAFRARYPSPLAAAALHGATVARTHGRTTGSWLIIASSGQPGVQQAGTFLDLADLDVLVLLVREIGIAGAEVQRGDAQRGEARHVGPAVLAARLRADGGHELL